MAQQPPNTPTVLPEEADEQVAAPVVGATAPDQLSAVSPTVPSVVVPVQQPAAAPADIVPVPDYVTDQIPAAPGRDYGQLFQTNLKLLKKTNPGIPPEQLEQQALQATVAVKGQADRQVRLEQEAMAAAAAKKYEQVAKQNQMRTALGLPALPLPEVPVPTAPPSESAKLAAQIEADLKKSLEQDPGVQQQKDAQVEQFIQPLRRQVASKLALDEIEQMRQDAEVRQQQAKQELDEKIAAIDNEVRQRSLPEIMQQGSFGSKLMAVLALSMGAAGAALTGQPNAAITYFNRIADDQARRDKLNQEEKEVLRRAVFQQGQVELNKLEQATNSAYKKDVLRMQQQQLAQQIEEANQRILQAAQQNLGRAAVLSGKREIGDEEFAALSDREREAVVTLEDGRRVMATNKKAADDFKVISTEVGGAKQSLKSLIDTIKNANRLDPREWKKAQSRVQQIIGQLRVPLTGPGVLTDYERNQLLDIIGTFGPFSIRGLELAKAETLMKDLDARLAYNAKTAGIRMPLTKQPVYKVGDKLYYENDLVKHYKKQVPNVSDDKVLQLIRRQIPQN